MPKDARKNVDRYKIAGGHLNEYEFHQNQGQVQETAKAANYGPGENLAVKKADAKAGAGTSKKIATNAAKKAGKKAAKNAGKKVSKKAGKKAGKKAAAKK